MASISEVDKGAALKNILQLFVNLIAWAGQNSDEYRLDGKPKNTVGGGRPWIYFYATYAGKNRLFYLASDTTRESALQWALIVVKENLASVEAALRYTINRENNYCLRLGTTTDHKNNADGWNCREVIDNP